MDGNRRSRWLAAVVLGSLAIYATTLTAGFTYDDVHTIRGHVGVHGPFSFHNIFLRDFWGLPFDRTVGTWRPVATLTYWVDWHLAGGAPWVFHATNLVVYASLLWVCHAFLVRWAGDSLSPTARLFVTAAYGAMTIHVDVVPSPTGRAEMLAAVWVLLALWACMPRDRHVTWREVSASGVFLSLALVSKESAFPMALVAPYLIARHHQAQGTVNRRRLATLAASAVAALGGVLWFRAGRLPLAKPQFDVLPDNVLHALPWWQQKLASGEVITHYLAHMLTGLDLVPDYSYSSIHVTTSGISMRAVLGLSFYAGVAWVAIRWFRKGRRESDAAVGFMGSFLVASHLVVPASAMVADRLFFFPSFWLLVLAGTLTAQIRWADPGRQLGPKRLLLFGFAGLVGVQALITAAAATNWHDDAVLFTQALQTRPHVARTRVSLSMVLYGGGKFDEAAWNVLLAHVYYTRFPEPIPDSDFPLEWDELPMSARLSALRVTLGDATTIGELTRAEESSRAWGQEESARVLALWRKELVSSSHAKDRMD